MSVSDSGRRSSLPITLQRMMYLDAFERATSLDMAAVTCGVTAAVLTQGLSELERELGATLVVRRTGRHGLTSEGKIFLVRARSLLQDFALLRGAVAAMRNETPQSGQQANQASACMGRYDL